MEVRTSGPWRLGSKAGMMRIAGVNGKREGEGFGPLSFFFSAWSLQLGAVSGMAGGRGRAAALESGAVSGSFLSKLGKVAWEIGAVGWGKGWRGMGE